MHKRIEILRIINNILIVTVIATVALMTMQLKKVPAIAVVNVTLALFVLFSEAISAFINNLVAFLAAHGLAMALCSYISFSGNHRLLAGDFFAGVYLTSVIQVMHIMAMIIITIIAIYARLDGKGRFYPTIFEGFLFIGLYLLCLITGEKTATVFVLFSEVIWGILCIIFYNARQTIGALVTFKDRDYIPYDSIKRTNGLMLKLSLVVAFVLMLACTLIDYGREVMAMLKAGISALLRFIFSFLKFESQEEYDVPETAMSSGGGMFTPEEYVDNSIWHTIWQILFWIVAIVVTIGVIILFVMMVKEFYKLFNSSRNNIKDGLARDKIEYLSPWSVPSKVFSGSDSSRMRIRDRLSPSGRIRLLFTRYIEKNRGLNDINGSDTPLEMEEKIISEREASAYKLYEKARYSSNEITQADIQTMKNICR